MKRTYTLAISSLVLVLSSYAFAMLPSGRAPLPDFDRRHLPEVKSETPSPEQTAAVARLRERLPHVRVDFHDVIASPKMVSVPDGFLSGPGGGGKGVSPTTAARFANDPHRSAKAFLDEHRPLFGHGPEALDHANVKREFVTPHSGMTTVVWEQEVDGIPVYEGVLVAHITRAGELVNISSQFLQDPVAAANWGTPDRAALQVAPAISTTQAVVLAAKNIGEGLMFETLTPKTGPNGSADQRARFTAVKLKGDSEAKLVWLPMDARNLRLCWDVVLMSAARGEMFRSLVDAKTGDVLVRRCLTEYLSDATYRVYTSDSPSPLSPGLPAPATNQPPLVPRQLLTLSALDTNASPAGWINDGDNETTGNNVDAHLDRNADDQPDLPRPRGNPFRVFDFVLDLNQSPTTYGNASVVQLFYWCNWMHDKLYELGFTEAAGNFQNDNFGRGGLGGDALQADEQDGSGTDNANMSTPPDGMPPRIQMYLFTGPKPNRDGSLDAEVVLHEYTHGLSNRRVGGGVGISALQSGGMGEGWSDFYALTLLSEPADDMDGTYASGAYASYLLGGLKQNYYFGIRRYPYCTDLNKNPLTFKDIDPAQASNHAGIPCSPIIGSTADEVHNMGEVWCVTLWEARANLIRKHGFSEASELTLQLVTDGMNLSPPNPNFLQARDAIIQADLADTGGANRKELWAAFAKRGMGLTATSPSSSTTAGVHEAYDVPDDLDILPQAGFIAAGPIGGPFNPAAQTFVLTNAGSNTITWTATAALPWLNLLPASGTLAVAGTATMTATLDLVTASLPGGSYSNSILFTNLTSSRSQSRDFALQVGQPDYFTELFEGSGVPRNTAFTFTPDGSASFYSVSQAPATNFPTAPQDAAAIALPNDGSQTFTLSGFNTVSLYGFATNVLFVSAYGNVTFMQPDDSGDQTVANHFSLPRISALVSHLHPDDGGTVYFQELSDRVATTFQNVPEYMTAYTNSFQVEMFFDGRIRLTYLDIGTTTCLIGLSAGNGLPADFVPSRFSGFGAGQPALAITVPASATEGDGLLAAPGTVVLPAPLATDLVVNLMSALPATVAVPSSITIPAGETNASFGITVNDDHLLNGTRRINISASADGFASGAGSLTILDKETATLSLCVPATVTEGDGVVPATVKLSAAPASSVLVNLASSDLTEIQLPPFIIVSAGQTSAVFNLTVINDTEIDGAQTATLTAHVDNWTDGVAAITVLDNEDTNLVVTLPQTATEGQGTRRGAGKVSISGTLGTNLAIGLTSSYPSKLAVPAAVTIAAGQTSAVFDLTVLDDSLAEGTQTATVTANAPGFRSSSSTIQLWDKETPPMPALRYPPHLAAGIAATNTSLAWNGGEGELTINGGFESGDFGGWTQTNTGYGGFAIADSSYVPPGPAGALQPYAGTYCAVSIPLGPSHSELYQDLTIPAGAVSATLSWADSIRNFASDFGTNQYFRVELRTTNNQLLQVAYTTNPGDPLLGEWTLRNVDLANYIGTTVRIAFVQEVYPYYMNVFLDSVGLQLGASPLPSQYFVFFGTKPALGTSDFLGTTTNSNWNLPVLAPLTTYYWQIISKRVGQTAGPVWQFTTRGVDHFDWNTVASPQILNQPFTGSLVAKDELNRVVTNCTAPVSLSAVANFPFTASFEDDFEDEDFSDWTAGSGVYTCQIDSQTAAVGTHSLTLIGGNQSALDGLSHTFSNLTPHLISFYVRGKSINASGGYFVVGDGATVDNIAAFFFQMGDGTMGIYEDQGGWHGVPCEANRWYKISLVLDWDSRQLDYYVDDRLAIAGIPFRGSTVQSINQLYLYNYDNTQSWWDDIRLGDGKPPMAVALAPTNSANFTNGSWSGPISILEPADTLHLVAQDSLGHRGVGNDFSVSAANDLNLAMIASSNLAALGRNLAYTLIVSNTGPQAAKGVYVIDALPYGVQLESATTSQGTYAASADSVFFELGTLNGAGAATLTVVVAPTNAGFITNWAVVLGADPDPYIDNNVAELTTPVMPALSIGDVALPEGNLGTSDATFPVTLSAPFSRPIHVNYATTNGTALAGVDYQTNAGILFFPPGGTSNSVTVAVLGNTVIEANKQFYVNLNLPFNATLARSRGTGTILNDDGLPGDLYTLQWDPVPSPQFVNLPFSVTLTAWDANNHIATNFNGTAALSASEGILRTNAVGTSTYTEDFPLGASWPDERTQVIYLPGELGGAGRIISLALDVAMPPGTALDNWTIRMKHTPLSSYSYGQWESSGWTVMQQTNLTINSAGWMTFQFATPFDYNGTSNLMVDFSFSNPTMSSDGLCHSSYQSTVRTLYCQEFSYYGDPLTWSGTYPYPYSSSYTPNIRVTFGNPIPVDPIVTDNFVQGVWSGQLAVQGFGTNVSLLADDLNGHTGLSKPFAVSLTNDLALSMSVSSNAITIGQQVTCTLLVTNSGPQPANGVLVSNALPSGVNLVSAPSSQGISTITSNSVVFALGQLTNGQTAIMTLQFRPNLCTTFTNLATISRNEPEDYLLNNRAQTVFVVWPAATVNDVAINEGNLGTTPVAFKVSLSSPFDKLVTMYYATADGTAVAGKDYISTSGNLIFNPGVTSAIVRVLIIGNTRIEPNRTFFVNLSSPVNVTLFRSKATGTILNDDGLPGDVFTLAWTPFASPQFFGRQFGVTLTARDAAGNLVTAFNGKAAVVAGKGAVRASTIGIADTEESFPFYSDYQDARTQVIYLANELGGAGQITSIALNLAYNPGLSFKNWTVRMKHTSLSNYSSYAWESTGWTVVLQTNLTVNSTGWVVLPLARAFDYNGTANLMVDFSFRNPASSSAGYCWSSYRGQTRTIYYGADASSGNPLSWSGTSPSPYTSTDTPDLRVGFGTPIPCQPAIADHFTNGVWAGSLGIFEIGTNIVLSADDRNGHVAYSTPFVVAPIDDVSLTVAAWPDPLSVTQSLAYTIVVTNTGPSAATGVIVTNLLPPSTSFVSASPGPGTFALADHVVVFNIGNVGPASAATLGLVVNPTSTGTLTNYAAVRRDEADNYLPNNTVTTITRVIPALSIPDIAFIEGNSGTKTAVFPVTLSGAFDQPVQVSFSTANGTATAGSDYAATSGTVIFPPGTTTNAITVTINGDIFIEPDETFYVNLSAPVNTSLARAQAVGTILNDDGLPGDAYTLLWNTIPSPQFVNVPFAATLSAWDAGNQLATNFNGSVVLTAPAGTRTNVVGTGTSTQDFPLGTLYHDERTQVIYLRSELGGAGRILALSLDVSTLPGQGMTNWTIRMKHTPLSQYGGSSAWESSGWTVMTQTNLTVRLTGLLTFRFATPFAYNGVDNLMVDFSFNNSSYASDGYCRATSQSAARTLYYQTDSGYGDPLTWSGSSSPYPYTSSYTPNLRVQFDDAIPVQPASTGNFTNGVWTGLLALEDPRSRLILLADDLNGHTNVSNPFEVRLINDVAISLSDSPDPLTVGQNLTYTTVVTNTGPLPAQGVMVTNFLPSTVTFVSANTSQGAYTNLAGQVVFNLGMLPGPGSAVLHLMVAPTVCGFLTNVATLGRSDPDNYLPNNSASVTTAVVPFASIAGVTLKEGNVGVTNAIFTVSLSEAFSQTVQLSYATADGTAKATIDYLSTIGTLSFPPGTTMQAIAVPVLANTVIEPDKTFVVNLTAVTNVVVSTKTATAIILNDDGLPGDLYTLDWDPIGWQTAGQPFTATLTARDAGRNLATNFYGGAWVSARDGAGATNITGAGTYTQIYPIGGYSRMARTQTIYLTNEVGAAGTITAIALNVNTLPGRTLDNWTIRMKHTSLKSYSSYAWDASNWTVVLQTNLQVIASGWITLPLQSSFAYNGTNSLMIDCSYSTSAYASGGGYCFSTSVSQIRTLNAQTEYYGDPLTWSGSSPYPSSASYVPNLRIIKGNLLPVYPSAVGPFTNGMWIGTLAIGAMGTNVTLTADDQNGHIGLSNPFVVVLTNDISVTLAAAPLPAAVGVNLTYTLNVIKSAPNAAIGIIVSNYLPAGVTYVSGHPKPVINSNKLSWSFATLDPGSNITISIVVAPTAMGLITNLARVTCNETDSYESNNAAQLVTRVYGPEVAVFDDPLYVSTSTATSISDEEQSSLTNLGFPVVTFTNMIAAATTRQQLLFPELTYRDLSGDLSPTAQGALSNFVYQGGKLIVHGSSTLRASRLINKVFGCSVQETYVSSTCYRSPEAAGTAFATTPATLTGNYDGSVLQRATLPPGALGIYTNSDGTSVSMIGFGNGCVIFLGWNWFNSAPVGTQDGGWLSILAGACLAQPTAPRAPANLTAEAAVAEVKLSWTAMAGATHYTVKRADVSQGGYTAIASLPFTNYIDTAVANEIPYYYVVSALNAWGESSNSIEASATPHAPPQVVAILANSIHQLTLSWPGWATNYRVYATTNLDFTSWQLVTNLPQTTNGMLFLSLPTTNDLEKFFRLGTP